MRLTSSIPSMALKLAIAIFVFSVCGVSGWCYQSQPPEKDASGSQAGSAGKADKTKKAKMAKKPKATTATTKSS